jgi:hypothetical protein
LQRILPLPGLEARKKTADTADNGGFFVSDAQ